MSFVYLRKKKSAHYTRYKCKEYTFSVRSNQAYLCVATHHDNYFEVTKAFVKATHTHTQNLPILKLQKIISFWQRKKRDLVYFDQVKQTLDDDDETRDN